MNMAILQVKSVPDDLYAAIRARAREEHITLSDLVVRTLRAEVERPSLKTWAAEQQRLNAGRATRPDIDIEALMDEVRGDPAR